MAASYATDDGEDEVNHISGKKFGGGHYKKSSFGRTTPSHNGSSNNRVNAFRSPNNNVEQSSI